jgi:hypothetical protein
VRTADGRSKAHCELEAAFPVHFAAGVAAVTRPGSGSNPGIRIISVFEGNIPRGGMYGDFMAARLLERGNVSVRGASDVNPRRVHRYGSQRPACLDRGKYGLLAH